LPTDVPGISYVLFTGGTNDWNSYLEVACNWLDRKLPSILQGHYLVMSRVYQKLRTFVQDLQSSLMLPLSLPKPPDDGLKMQDLVLAFIAMTSPRPTYEYDELMKKCQESMMKVRWSL